MHNAMEDVQATYGDDVARLTYKEFATQMFNHLYRSAPTGMQQNELSNLWNAWQAESSNDWNDIFEKIANFYADYISTNEWPNIDYFLPAKDESNE